MTMEEWGSLRGCRYLLHDRDAKFCESFRKLIGTGSVNPLRLPARSPNPNSCAERWVRSVKEECLSRGKRHKVDGIADAGLTISGYIKDTGNVPLPSRSTSVPLDFSA
jgi:hypothetical protein